jgi:hypothetical protein
MVLTLHLLGSLKGNDALFFPLVFLHAISALAGFGSIGFAGTYASRAAQIPYSGWAPTGGTLLLAPPEVPLEEGALLEREALTASGEPVDVVWLDADLGPEASHPGFEPGDLDDVEPIDLDLELAAGPVPDLATTEPAEEIRIGPAEMGGGPSGPGEVDPAPPGVRADDQQAGTTVVQVGAYAIPSRGSELDPESEELMRYFQRPARFWKAILLVPVFGLLALWAQPRTAGLDQVWTLAALLVWIAASLVVISMVMPGLRQMRTMLLMSGAHPGTPAAEAAWRARLARSGAMASRGAVICDVLFFVALALMIWRP